MQLESLRIFCDVVRWSSFSRGAAQNGISQSTASQAVHQLEMRLGVKLIDRSKRPLVPTPQGRVFYEGCRELVARYEELEARVRSLDDEPSVMGTVRVASIYSVGLAHLTAYADRFRSLYPQAEVKLDYQHPTAVVESVRQGRSDLGLISFPKRWPDLTVIPWKEEEMVVVVNPRHRLSSQTEVEVGQLDGLEAVTFEPDLAIRRAIDRFLRKHGVQVEVVLAFDNIENIKRAVIEMPTGLAILPRPTLEREIGAGLLAALPFCDAVLKRPLAIVHRGAGGLSVTATRFLRLLSGESRAGAGVGERVAATPAS
ncbi:MAG: transcriptional regulator [Isosphaeraceae bacterium]|jgi:DNA-binding transcriptional LysR family regulator|nr:MAG: transcriptional regulator [Isosphaeraceae bacterium]